jgi:uncharacterized membrane protein
MPARSSTISSALLLLRINALLWLAFAVLTACGAHPAIPNSPLIRWGLASMALAGALALLILERFLRRRSRVAFYVTLTLLAVVALLLLADQFGLPDLVVLILTAAPFVLLIIGRAEFLRPNLRQSNGGPAT